MAALEYMSAALTRELAPQFLLPIVVLAKKNHARKE